MPRPSADSPLTFRRSTVADQTAAALRTAIEGGQLPDPLPGEVSLARRLGVSRPSVHAALEQLERLGLVAIHVGRRTRIVARSPGRSARPARRSLTVISVGADQARFLSQTPIMLHLQAEAVSRGFEWESMFDARLAAPSAGERLRQIVASRVNTCWMLYSCPGWLHRWFADARLPTVILGSCADGVALPSVDLDFRSVGWHAAGMLTRNGHRRIALLLPASPLPGDLACRDGFRAYFARRQDPEASISELAIPVAGARQLSRLRPMLTGPRRATAVFVMREANAVAAYTQVLALGLAVPRDVSVISRDTHPLIDAALPHLTRYGSSPLRQATLAFRIAQSVLAGRAGRPRPRLATPQFIPGTTLGPAPAPACQKN